MKNQLKYFNIENSYGGNQDWFTDPIMKIGGCAAVAAMESCIYFDLHGMTKGLYPFNINSLSKDEYKKFAKIMKQHLHPRWGGIDTTELFINGFSEYLQTVSKGILKMKSFGGNNSLQLAKDKIKQQIDSSYPIPYLLLKHKNYIFRDFEWHWFMVTGYSEFENDFMIQTVTYGESIWLDFNQLWKTGFAKKGGLILYNIRGID